MNFTNKQYLGVESSINDAEHQQKQNGKAICSVCLKENYEEEDNKFAGPLFQDLNKRTQFLIKKHSNLLNSQKATIHSRPNKQIEESERFVNNHGYQISLFSNNPKQNILINACNCDKLIHTICLLKWCVLNMTVQCSQCGKYFNNIEFDEEQISHDEKLTHFCQVILYISFIIASLVIAVMFFASTIHIDETYGFWNYILGIIFVVMSVLFSFSLSWIVSEIFKKRIGNIRLANKTYNKEIEVKEEEKLRVFEDFSALYNFKYNQGGFELVEQKYNNNLYLNSVNLDTNKLRKYVVKYGMKSTSQQRKNNDIVEIPVDKLSINKGLVTNTYTSAAQYLKKQNSFVNRNAKAPNDQNPPQLNRSKTKKSEDSKRNKEENKNSESIKIKVESKGSRVSNHLKIPDNMSMHSIGENNTEHNQLLPIIPKPIDFLNKSPKMKMKDNVANE